ncbi:MAG TPA: class I SAM-dependent methyltransferase [Pyrinomonadaceae bacterium]|nr:class I SAM-dependent methyltransferase [Pyrinomonadaceae bacterium]
MSQNIQDIKVSQHANEVNRGERFRFGENWSRFLAALDDERIREAEDSLRRMLETESLAGQSFLDIGSGSGLFSLAARRLGARVHSLDYDPQSVACTAELRRRYFPEDAAWAVEEGSALDTEYMKSLGSFDVVYSWGVLHHTGEMWRALDNAQHPVKPGGRLFIAIYNDTGTQAERWKWIKKTYNRLPSLLRPPFAVLAVAPDEIKPALRSVITLRPQEYVRRWTRYNKNRGMSRWRDILDWVGGYPYEVATPDEIFDFYRARGFTLTKLKCGGVGLGCNEFVFLRNQSTENGRVL